MDLILVILGVIVVIGAIVATSLYSKKKRIEAVWSGVIINKDIKEDVHSDSNVNRQNSVSFGMADTSSVTHRYLLYVKTDEDKELTWPVTEGLYQSFAIGDRLKKAAGSEYPEVTSKAVHSAPIIPNPPNATPPVTDPGAQV